MIHVEIIGAAWNRPELLEMALKKRLRVKSDTN